MRLISLTLILALAGCAPMNVSDLKSDGLETVRYQSDKTPMQMAGCMIPVYGLALPNQHPAQMRATATGLEVVKTGAFMMRVVVLGVISIDAAGDGSSVTGVATDHGFSNGARLAEVDAVIRQCV